MSTQAERDERKRPGSEWLTPAWARKLREEHETMRTELLKAGRIILDQERIIAELRAERLAWYAPMAEA